MKRLIALVLALLVHALTLAFVVLGGWTIVINAEFGGWLIGGVLIAIGWALRPRLGRLPADAEVLDRSSAKELYAAAERVADKVGVKRPRKVAIRDLEPSAHYFRAGPLRTPVLVVGLPLWLALTPRQRAGLLACAYAETPTGEQIIVNGALFTLGEWRESLLGAEPSKVRDEAQTKIAMSSVGAYHPGTAYEAVGLIGRIFGRVLGGPVLLLEYALRRLARSGESRGRQRRTALAQLVLPPDELAELDELVASRRYLVPIQAAALRGEGVPSIRDGALADCLLTDNGVLTTPPGSELLGAAESARIDDELLAHYTRAIRGFGLIS
ncbi:M48 family metallopeptidase [Nonomuraea sp. NPDC000554]|uniref:M48 family metallopeptidase n=1 Tax=Nonomuraea sp. NPDC000554 TaxID=3154259 RepID=UPI003324C778